MAGVKVVQHIIEAGLAKGSLVNVSDDGQLNHGASVLRDSSQINAEPHKPSCVDEPLFGPLFGLPVHLQTPVTKSHRNHELPIETRGRVIHFFFSSRSFSYAGSREAGIAVFFAGSFSG